MWSEVNKMTGEYYIRRLKVSSNLMFIELVNVFREFVKSSKIHLELHPRKLARKPAEPMFLNTNFFYKVNVKRRDGDKQVLKNWGIFEFFRNCELMGGVKKERRRLQEPVCTKATARHQFL